MNIMIQGVLDSFSIGTSRNHYASITLNEAVIESEDIIVTKCNDISNDIILEIACDKSNINKLMNNYELSNVVKVECTLHLDFNITRTFYFIVKEII